MTKKEIKKTHSITMEYFLKMFVSIDNDNLVKELIKLSHYELKQVIKIYDIKVPKISFDDLTKDMIARGDVLLVKDVYGHPAPYINPLRILVNEYETTLDEEFISHEINEGVDTNDKYKGRQKIKYFKP